MSARHNIPYVCATEPSVSWRSLSLTDTQVPFSARLFSAGPLPNHKDQVGSSEFVCVSTGMYRVNMNVNITRTVASYHWVTVHTAKTAPFDRCAGSSTAVTLTYAIVDASGNPLRSYEFVKPAGNGMSNCQCVFPFNKGERLRIYFRLNYSGSNHDVYFSGYSSWDRWMKTMITLQQLARTVTLNTE